MESHQFSMFKFPKGSLFLVTGGAGFIGSNLCETILKLGYRVRCLDNLSTGNKKNVDMFSKNHSYEFIEGSITNYIACLFACQGVDYVLHQAARTSVPESIKQPALYLESNVLGTLNMLRAAKVSGVKKFVYASSAAVYGDDISLHKVEGKEGNPLSPYALTKKTCEQWARIYTFTYGLDTYGLRYFNVFGKRQDPDSPYAAVVPKFIAQLSNDEQPMINGDGTQTRDFVYVQDVVQANLKACLASHEVAGQVFNIASGKTTSLLNLYDTLVKLLDKDISPVYAPTRAGDIKHSSADISKAKQYLSYSPTYSLMEGLKEIIDGGNIWRK